MSEFVLQATVREERGKEKAKKLRQAGAFPAIVYGAKAEPVALTLDIRETDLVLERIQGEKILVTLNYADTADKVFVRNVQRDPMSDKLVHVDFYRVDLTKEMDTRVPIIATGLPKGVKEGGMLDTVSREVAIRCLPAKVPPHIVVPVDHLNVGDSIQVNELEPIDGVQFTSSPDMVLFSVLGRQAEPEPEVEAEVPEGEVGEEAEPAEAPAE